MTTVVTNLSSDMHTAAFLTQGALLLSRQLGARWRPVHLLPGLGTIVLSTVKIKYFLPYTFLPTYNLSLWIYSKLII